MKHLKRPVDEDDEEDDESEGKKPEIDEYGIPIEYIENADDKAAIEGEEKYNIKGPESNIEGFGLFRKDKKNKGGEGTRDTMFRARRTSIRKKGDKGEIGNDDAKRKRKASFFAGFQRRQNSVEAYEED